MTSTSARINDLSGGHDAYDAWVFDEQNEDSRLTGAREEGTAYANTILKVLDGQECRLDTKYGKVFTKTKKVPIIMIANKLPSSTRYHGPLRGRFIRVPFSPRITEIEEERLVATLWGCVHRRAIQAYAGFYPTPVDIKID